jgi:hypothetical protein
MGQEKKMSDKSSGIDFDRQAFVQQQAPLSRPSPHIGGLILALVAIAAIAFLGYKLVPQIEREPGSTGDPALADLDKRLAAIEGRMEKLETPRTAAMPPWVENPADPKQAMSRPPVKVYYQIPPAPPQQAHASDPQVPAPDPETAQRLSSLQQGLGALQSDQAANREAWQATNNRVAEIQGQVGTQGVQILQSQDELNQLLARTEIDAIPFELLRGASPQQVGPVSLFLKNANPKTQRYTVCAFVQSACIELKDRSLHEVVQFVASRNSAPLGIIATKIMKYQILGYLEVPRDPSAH